MADEPTTESIEPEEVTEPEGDPPLEDAGKKALNSERRARAVAEKEAKALKARLDEIEAERLSKEERAAKEAADAKSEAENARQEALRWRYRPDGMPDEDVELYLTGSDEETIRRQAERYQQLFAAVQSGKGGPPVPGVGSRPEKPPTLQEQIRAAEADGNQSLVMQLKTQQLMEARNTK